MGEVSYAVFYFRFAFGFGCEVYSTCGVGMQTVCRTTHPALDTLHY